MMKTTWRTWFLTLGAALSLTACSDDDNYVQPTTPQPTEAGAYVLNQGSFNLVDGTLGYLNLTAGTMSTDDLFAAANEGRSMGDTPQDLVVYGSHIYLAVYGSNVVWVLDRTTRAIEQMITTEQPRDLIAADGNVYVSNYNRKKIDGVIGIAIHYVSTGGNEKYSINVCDEDDLGPISEVL